MESQTSTQISDEITGEANFDDFSVVKPPARKPRSIYKPLTKEDLKEDLQWVKWKLYQKNRKM